MPIKKLQKFAVFDIDGTIFRSSLLIKLVDELIAKGLFPKSAGKIYHKAYEQWLDRKGDYESYLGKVIKTFDQHIVGLPAKRFEQVCQQVTPREKNRTYRFTRDLVKQLDQQGYVTIAISHSPKPAVEVFCKALGFKRIYGIMYEHDGRGKMTGKKMHSDVILNKQTVLQLAINKLGLTLKGSIAVGDTESDIPMLSSVEKPIAFNPNDKLARHAKQKNWDIIVERKNVIYQVKDFKFLQ